MIKTTTLSTFDSEILGVSLLLEHLLYVNQLLINLLQPVPQPLTVLVDNQATIASLQNDKGSSLKYIRLRLQHIADLIQTNVCVLQYVSTKLNVADIHTKPLGGAIFKSHRNNLFHPQYVRSHHARQ